MTTAVWTAESIRALGVTTDVVTAGAILGVGASTSRDLDRRGSFPVPGVAVGRARRVPTAGLLKLLGLDDQAQQPAAYDELTTRRARTG